jgi:hypothetical protein
MVMLLKDKYKFTGSLLLACTVGLIAGFGISLLQSAPKVEQVAIYGTDAQQTAAQVDLYVGFPNNPDQRQSLDQLANTLSHLKFCELPIEVTELKEGIATINLSEHAWNQNPQTPSTFPGCSGKSWRSQYFQGSAGGYDTTVALTRTFLQPDVQRPWIQGVRFSYQGQPIQSGQWDHIFLDGVITRENLP